MLTLVLLAHTYDKGHVDVANIAKDDLLNVKRIDPLVPSRKCIIVPRQVLDGPLKVIQIQLIHSFSHQLKAATKRYLHALDIDEAIDRAAQACYHCAALRQT